MLVQEKMTRFARAKGSKASNERLPNEATPWNVMKQQIEENKNKSLEKKKSAKELLKEHEDFFNESTNKNTQEWAEFEDNRSKSDKRKHKNSNLKRNFTKNSKNNVTSENNIKDSQKDTEENIGTDKKTTKSSNKKKKEQNINNTISVSSEKDSAQELNTPQDTHSNYVVLSKRQKRNQKRKLEMSNDGSKKFKKDVSGKNNNIHTKKEKIKKKGEYKRRKSDAGVTKIVINGVETEIVMYDRFPVKKEDAERLAELKQKMIMKGKYTILI